MATGPFAAISKRGFNCCEDLMIRSSTEGMRCYELFVIIFLFLFYCVQSLTPCWWIFLFHHTIFVLCFLDVNSALYDLHKTRKDFEARVGFTEDLEKLSGVSVITAITKSF